jgi:HUS1 checkpoint protein
MSFKLQTLVQVPELQNLIGLIDRLGKLGEVLEVAVTQYGDLHLRVSQTMVSSGSEYRKLRVIGVRGIPTKHTFMYAKDTCP